MNEPAFYSCRMKLKVAVVTESFLPQLNGVSNSVVRILETLKEQGHEAILIAPTAPSDNFLGFPVIRTSRFIFRGFPVALPLLNLTSILRSFNPDVVHVASPAILGRQALAVSKRLGFPSIAVYQTDLIGYSKKYGLGLLEGFGKAMVRRMHLMATMNLAPTQKSLEELSALGVPRLEVWGRGVDLENFSPRRRKSETVKEIRSRFAPNGEVIIGYVGRIAPEKQVDRLSELLPLENAVFVMVGDGPERETLTQRFANAPVSFVGPKTGEELHDHYAAFDIFVHFGERETFGQTIQEAMASGVPVVAPNRGGPSVLVDHGATGFLVDPDVDGAYFEPVQTLLSDETLRKRMSKTASEAMQHRTWSANNKKLVDFYFDVAGATTLRAGA
ncbi:MAG: glycosyltransferase family 1 protein [Microbacteriaceae bacterium]|nr:glycosyltransferase family 1 protein [Microbacteriaceae bacterium]